VGIGKGGRCVLWCTEVGSPNWFSALNFAIYRSLAGSLKIKVKLDIRSSALWMLFITHSERLSIKFVRLLPLAEN
jgi:hypothetical protein